MASVSAISNEGGAVVVTADGVQYTSAAGFTGQDSFDYVVTDQRGGTATGVVTLTVGNAKPAAPDRTLTTTAAGTIDLLGGASDPDGQLLTVSLVGPAEHGTVTIDSAGVATYTPNEGFVGRTRSATPWTTAR